MPDALRCPPPRDDDRDALVPAAARATGPRAVGDPVFAVAAEPASGIITRLAPPPAVANGESCSRRPTTKAELDPEIMALAVTPRYAASPLPPDLAVPVLVSRVPGVDHALGLTALFVFLHVDGRSSIADIAYLVGMPKAEVAAIIQALADAGAVRIGPRRE